MGWHVPDEQQNKARGKGEEETRKKKSSQETGQRGAEYENGCRDCKKPAVGRDTGSGQLFPVSSAKVLQQSWHYSLFTYSTCERLGVECGKLQTSAGNMRGATPHLA